MGGRVPTLDLALLKRGIFITITTLSKLRNKVFASRLQGFCLIYQKKLPVFQWKQDLQMTRVVQDNPN